jgi:Uri superfamily endonuclease
LYILEVQFMLWHSGYGDYCADISESPIVKHFNKELVNLILTKFQNIQRIGLSDVLCQIKNFTKTTAHTICILGEAADWHLY